MRKIVTSFFLFFALTLFILSGCKFVPETGSGSGNNAIEKKLNELTVSGGKTAYSAGEKFTISGLVITAKYSDNTTSRILPANCSYYCDGSEYDTGTVLNNQGNFTITVKYQTVSGTYRISVGNRTIPSYKDDYREIAGFNNRNEWNLGNTHDPTVIYWPSDGYYYMWGTDASFGNAHDDATTGKHFQGKRSKNLVDWEWVPGPMNSCPAWVNTKLNEIRAEMRSEKIVNGETVSENELKPIDMTTTANAKIIGYWAPCARVITVNGVTKIRMYYSIVCDYMIGSGAVNDGNHYDGTWSERAMIGVCETTNPNGGPSAWTDLGFVTCSSSDRGTDYSRSSVSSWSDAYFYFNAIDPTYFIDDDDTHWMIYGSWHSGFSLVRINPETGKIAAVDGDDYLSGNVTGDFIMGKPWANSAQGLMQNGYGTRIYTRNNNSRWQASEGPELVKYNGFYYLFFANDALDVPYQTRVVRSSKITGPYYDIKGYNCTLGTETTNPLPLVTAPYIWGDYSTSNYGWVGFSHCAVFQDTKGDWFYMSQARFPTTETLQANGITDTWAPNAVMVGHVNRIEWTPVSQSNLNEKWPMILPERYGGFNKLAKNEISADDIAGTWDHINLEYKYKTQNTSQKIVFTKTSENGGICELGDWSFDEESNVLKIGTRAVIVGREVDWESSPRKMTLVYTGIGGSEKTYWGKKSESVDMITLPYKAVTGTISSAQTIRPFVSNISKSTGMSVSFNLKLGSAVTDATYEWEELVKILDSSGNYVRMDCGPIGVVDSNGWINIFEGDAEKGSSFTGDNWTIFCQDGNEQYVTMSFNPDGSIALYKNCNLALKYAAATKGTYSDSSATKTVASINEFVINNAIQNGFIVHATSMQSYTMKNIIIDVAVNDHRAMEIYTANK